MKKAFTLVELLVVIAIISVLASLLLPALEQAMFSARTATCQANMKQVFAAITLYENEWEDTPSSHKWGGVQNVTTPSYRSMMNTYLDVPLTGAAGHDFVWCPLQEVDAIPSGKEMSSGYFFWGNFTNGLNSTGDGFPYRAMPLDSLAEVAKRMKKLYPGDPWKSTGRWLLMSDGIWRMDDNRYLHEVPAAYVSNHPYCITNDLLKPGIFSAHAKGQRMVSQHLLWHDGSIEVRWLPPELQYSPSMADSLAAFAAYDAPYVRPLIPTGGIELYFETAAKHWRILSHNINPGVAADRIAGY